MAGSGSTPSWHTCAHICSVFIKHVHDGNCHLIDCVSSGQSLDKTQQTQGCLFKPTLVLSVFGTCLDDAAVTSGLQSAILVWVMHLVLVTHVCVQYGARLHHSIMICSGWEYTTLNERNGPGPLRFTEREPAWNRAYMLTWHAVSSSASIGLASYASWSSMTSHSSAIFLYIVWEWSWPTREVSSWSSCYDFGCVKTVACSQSVSRSNIPTYSYMYLKFYFIMVYVLEPRNMSMRGNTINLSNNPPKHSLNPSLWKLLARQRIECGKNGNH